MRVCVCVMDNGVDIDSGGSGSGVEAAPVPERKRRRRHPVAATRVSTVGAVCLYLVIGSRDNGWGTEVEHALAADEVFDQHSNFVASLIVGQWKFSSDPVDENSWAGQLRRIASRGRATKHFLEYHLLEMYDISEMYGDVGYVIGTSITDILNSLADTKFQKAKNGNYSEHVLLLDLIGALEIKYRTSLRWTAAVAFLSIGICMKLAEDQWSPFYTVALTGLRAPSRSKLLGHSPTSMDLKRYLHSVRGTAVSSSAAEVVTETKPHRLGLSAEKIFKWVKATRNLKQLRKLQQSRDDMIDTLDEDLGPDAIAMCKSRRSVAYDVVRRGRVRLDVVAMTIFRAWWAIVNTERLFINLYMDASPQKRGYELFAASMDMFWLTGGEEVKYFHARLSPRPRG